MKCTFCQILLEEDCDFCSHCGKEVVSTRKIVLCTGKKKNGNLCGAELQKGKNFCKKCGAKVDQSIFEKEVVLCANCGHAFADDEDLCVDCGFPRNGISDTLPIATNEDSAELSSIINSDPPPPSGLVLGQNTSLDDELYKRSQATPQDNDLDVDNKSGPPDKDIPVERNINPGKIINNEVCLEKMSESEFQSKGIIVNERFAVEERELIESSQKLLSQGNDSSEKYENSDLISPINEVEEKKNENVSGQIGNEKFKEINPEQCGEGDGVDKNCAHSPYIKTSDPLEKEVQMEATHSTLRQMVEKLETEQMGTSGNSINFAEKEIEKRVSVEEPIENYTDKKPTQETTPTADPSTLMEELKRGGESNSSGMETVESSKFDQNQSDEKTRNRNENQTSDALVDKVHGTKSESEEDKSQISIMKQGLGGKGSNITRTGNKGKTAGVVRVHFHSLVSAEFGLTSADVVLIRFGDEELGGWNSDAHRPELVRKYGDEYTEYKLVLDIPRRLSARNRQIQYKYVIGRNKVLKNSAASYVWEFYGTSGTANRTLDLPDIKNIVHQHDGIVFPKPGEGWWNKVMKFFKGDIKDRVNRNLFQSIEYFLPKFFQDVSRGQLPEVSVDEALNQLEDLLQSLKQVYCVDWECYSKLSDYKRKISDVILQPMLKSFEEVLLCKEGPAESKKRMLRATTVVSCIGYFNFELYREEEDLLARGLLVRPNPQTRICHDLDCIEKYFPKGGKKELSDFLISFINSMAKRAESPMVFFCIPLHHFLTGALKPFDRVPEDFSYDDRVLRWWGTEYLSKAVNIFIKGPHPKWAMNMDHVVSILYPMFEIDYLLPRTFMAMLKMDKVGDAIKTGKIPHEVSAATLILCVRTAQPGLDSSVASDEEKTVGDAIFALRDVCRAAVQKSDESSRADLIKHRMFYKIAGSLLKETLGSNKQFLVAGAVQILLNAVATYDVMQMSRTSGTPITQKQSEHLNILKAMSGDVRRWHAHHLNNWKAYLEPCLRCWDKIFAPNDLPSETVKENWNSDAVKDLNEILKGEMQQDTSSTNIFIELYCRKVETFHRCMQNCLNELAFKAIETGYCAEMHQLGSLERERFGRLLSSLYEREWETAVKKSDMEKDRIILQHILTWTPFSHFLRMFYGDEKNMYHLSLDLILELTEAISVINQKVHALEDGTVTIKDLSVIKDGVNKFQELIMILVEQPEKQIRETFNVVKAVKIRQKEVDSYLLQKKYVATLVQLCQRIHSVQISELDKTIRQLDKKKDNLYVRDICQPADVETAALTFRPHVTAYKLSAEVISMLEPMHTLYGSNIFLNLWQCIGDASKATTLDEVCEQIWKPTSSKMEKITKKLINGEIRFAKMEKYLGDIYRDNEEKMVEEMKLVNVPDATARERVKQLKQFRQMDACVHMAKTILKVAKAYELRGDFEVIKIIASQENAANMKMKEFDDSLLKTCTFLEDLTAEKTNCLEHFVICKNLVIWLRRSMRGGLKELKVFVDLASISAGEGDIEIAKVNCLHAATTGYASLIFDLDKHSGYKELLDKCQVLWKELKADPNLPKKLLDTSRHLAWLKTVKLAHGSVEVTSLAQTEAINSTGIFCVGALNTAKNTTMDLVFMEFKTEVAGDVLNSIKITYGKKGIDSLVSSLKKFAKVDTCDDRILVFCDSKHAEDVQECVTSHYNKAEKERTSPKENTNKYLINGGNDNLKEWLEFAFSHTSWSKNLEIEEDKLYLLGSVQMKREVDKAIQSKNHWYQEEFTLSSEEQLKANEVVAIVKNELPGVFIKLTKGKIEILSDSDGNIERAKYKVNMALDRIKITGRRRNQTNPQTYNKPFSDVCISEDDRMDAGLTLPSSSCHSNQPAMDLAAKTYSTKEGLIAKVYLGDLTSLPVDCIVNAANELLSHDGGVALAISKAAGRDFDQEGKEYVKKHGAIPVTQCCVTSSGKLPYKVVIHAVGPQWSDYKCNEKEKCTEDLKKTVVNCLIEANKFKMASIAIPSLSSGIFGVPKPLCSQMYAQAVVEYSMTYGLQSVKEINFVDMITDMCQLTKLAFDAELQ